MVISRKSLKFLVDTAVFKWKIFFLKRKIKNYVIKTRPIEVTSEYKEDGVLLMSLFCHKDVYEGIAAFKSLYRFLDVKYPLTIIEDGSLNDQDVETITFHLKNCHIIRRDKAEHEVNNYLKSNGLDNCLAMRKDFLMALKLFDASYYSFGKKVVIVDTDILFFSKPDALLNLIKRQREEFTPFYNKDLHSVYSYSVEAMERFIGNKILTSVNAGFIGWVPHPSIFQLTEKFLSLQLPYQSPWLVEQTMYALYFSTISGEPLPDDYDVMARHARKGLPVVCQHYAGFLRPHFYRQFLEDVYRDLI